MTIRRALAVTAALAVAGSILVAAPAALAGPVSPDVVNGRDPSPGEIRALVYVSAGGFSCGGTLVDATHVITAGHCSVDGNDRTLSPSKVRVSWASTTKWSALQSYPVTSVVTHPNYNPNTLDNDIAVLTLAAPISGATPMSVATTAQSQDALGAGDAVKSAGYGNLTVNGPASDTVQVADLTVMSDAVCGSANGSEKIGGITFYGMDVNTAHSLCAIGVVAGTRNIIDTCQGDSGGPLFSSSGTAVLLGVVSSGIGCAGEDERGPLADKTPGIYTRVAAYRDWLAAQGVDVGSTLPAAPRIVAAVAGADSLTVEVAPGDSTDFEGYWIKVINIADANDAFDCTVPRDESSCGFPDVTPGATYAVTAIAMGLNGYSPESKPTLVTIAEVPSLEPPARPVIVKGWDLGGGRIKLKVRTGNQPVGTSVYVYCASPNYDKTATVKSGYARMRLIKGAKYACTAYAENEAGLAQSTPFKFRL